ncbi:unnamed protein product [Ceutorhynchus assimilis]|uniref:Glutathione S-transferase n=1 Tax=Ceutorhynchus assimilis TaxID=467358 RepID=A0A9N9QQ18_9CUCU|nr:unnamed protein product [Ceutorhynchus assimilis]
MTKPKLYYAQVSPAARSTLLTIGALGLDVELVPVNLMAGEHLTPQFLKKNPLHTIPTLEDGDFTLFDSHAINAYLVTKYGKNDSLYPKDLQKRAIVDQRLHFDSGVVFPRMGAIVGDLLRGGAKTIAKEKADLVSQAYQSLEVLLEGKNFVAGNEVTIADFSLVSTVSSCNSAIVPIASNTYPRITAWLSRMQALPYYESNQIIIWFIRAFLYLPDLLKFILYTTNNMSTKLYYYEASAPARFILMLIKALNLDVELIRIDLVEKEHLKESFLKLNPTHTVPTLDDNGFVVWDSHSIAQYLADKFDEKGTFYPKTLEQRTIVNQMLFFESGLLFPAMANAVRPLFYDNATSIPVEKINAIENALGFLETFLGRNEYLAGEYLSIADISALATVNTIEIFYKISETKFPKVFSWLVKLKGQHFYEASLEGIEKFRNMFVPLLK